MDIYILCKKNQNAQQQTEQLRHAKAAHSWSPEPGLNATRVGSNDSTPDLQELAVMGDRCAQAQVSAKQAQGAQQSNESGPAPEVVQRAVATAQAACNAAHSEEVESGDVALPQRLNKLGAGGKSAGKDPKMQKKA